MVIANIVSFVWYTCCFLLERLFYWWLWCYPDVFSKIRDKAGWVMEEPYLLHRAVMSFKFIQLACYLEWTIKHGDGPWNIDITWYTPIAIAIAAFGQHLNYMVWKKLGVIGTCYGIRYKQKYGSRSVVMPVC